MNRLKILGHGRDMGLEKICFGTSIRHRMDETQDHYTMAKNAVERALKNASLTMEDIDLVVFASAIGYQPIPCAAALIKTHYPTTKPIPCMDINTSCTSFVTALDTVSYMMNAKRYKKVLIVSADTASLGLNPEQKESFELFSDASACFIFEHDENYDGGVKYALQMTWAESAHDTEIRGGLSSLPAYKYSLENEKEYLFDMKGRKVLKSVANTIPLFVQEYEKEMGSIKDVSMVIPHQASIALPVIMKRLNISEDKYINRIEEYGNMIASSIPFMLSLALDENLAKKGDEVLLFGTAAGLTISGLLLKI